MLPLDVAGQEILTKDKVALRINLNAGVRFVNVLAALAQQAKPLHYLYRELQFGLRAAVGTRTLDERCRDGSRKRQSEEHHPAGRNEDHPRPGGGSEKAAQANVIRRREETAATRSLLNTAKVMEDNPVALRMKELETAGEGHRKDRQNQCLRWTRQRVKDLVKIRA